MILRLKQRLSKYYLVLIVSLVLPLGAVFFYALRYETSFFSFIALALAINIIILVLFYARLKRKRAVVKLQKEEFFEKTNLLRTELQKESEVIGASREKIIAYSQLKELVEKISGSLSVEDSAHTLSYEVTGLLAREDSLVILYLLDPHSGELAIAHAARHHHPVALKQKQGDGFDRWVVKNLQPLLLEDARSDFRFDADKISGEDDRPVGSLISAPLLVGNKLIGILRLDSPVSYRFTSEDLRFLRTIADVGAVALENAQLYDKVEDLAIRDSLTGLYLKRYLLDRLGEEVNRHLRREKDLCFIMFDLDHFKKYNDRFGHTAGDIVLKYFAGLLQKHFHAPGNLVCRFGGEEFCVVLPEYAAEDAEDLVQEFIELVAEEEIVLRREKTSITVSAGLAAFPSHAKSREDLIRRADEALYAAKRGGRNRVCVA